MLDKIEQKEYLELINALKKEVEHAQIKARVSVNKELVALYWRLGNRIIEDQKRYNWGDNFIKQVAEDLRKEFPNMTGLSIRNIKYIRQFAWIFREEQFGQQAVAQIPWGHNTVLMNKKLSKEEYVWYAEQTVKNGWSRNVLSMQIESNLYKRQSGSEQVHNFASTLPSLQSDLASEILKDPYVLEFVDNAKNERELEKNLIEHIQKFLLELGKGFSFMGSQYPIEVGGDIFYCDLLFYHVKLHSYVVVELKTGKFKPEYAGKMNFYLNAIDKEIKADNDNATIGLILCKEKNKVVAEYALSGMNAPFAVSDYKLANELSEELKKNLPTEEEIAKELDFQEEDERENK